MAVTKEVVSPPSLMMQAFISDLIGKASLADEFIVVSDNAKPMIKTDQVAATWSSYRQHCAEISNSPTGRKQPCRWGSGASETDSFNCSSPVFQRPTKRDISRWDPTYGSPISTPLSPCTPPRRLPEHTDSFRINMRRFKRRCAFTTKTLSGRLTYGDESFKNRNRRGSAFLGLDDAQGELLQALLEIDAQCNSHRRGGIVVSKTTLDNLDCSDSPTEEETSGRYETGEEEYLSSSSGFSSRNSQDEIKSVVRALLDVQEADERITKERAD